MRPIRIQTLALIVGLFALWIACFGCGAPLKPPASSPPIVDTFNVACIVNDAFSHQPIAGASCTITGQTLATNSDGYALLLHILGGRGVTQTLTVAQTGYASRAIDFVNDHDQNVAVALVAERMFPPEVGPLHVEGTHFVTDGGAPWQGRSLTQFLLCARLWAGQSIQPQLTWAAAHGFNVVRVFGPVPWPDDFAQGLEMVPSAEQLDACFSAVEAAGLRIEYSALTYRYSIDQQRAFVQSVYDAAARHWGVFVEVANEPEVNGIDPVAVMQGVDRHAVLSSYGLDPERVPGPNYFHVPVLGYATSHDLARDEAHSPRNSKDTRDAEDVLHVPVWDDEPIGVIDPARYNFHQTSGSLWERPGGGSVRTTNCEITTAHAAIALALTGLTTYHFQAGLEGRIPADDEPIQAQCGSQIGALGSILTADAQLGAYSRPGINWPLTWTAGDGDSLVQHAYASINGGVAYVVVPMPAPGWTLQPIDGWTVDRVGAQPWIARLTR